MNLENEDFRLFVPPNILPGSNHQPVQLASLR